MQGYTPPGLSYTIREQNDIHFITFATVQWVDVFTRHEYQTIVVDSLKYCQEQKGLIVHGWCLMSNHIHLLVSAERPFELSAVMRDFKKFTSKTILQSIKDINESRRSWMVWLFESAANEHARNTEYQLWQHQLHAEHVFTREFFTQKLNYIHNNPVKQGIAEKPQDYMLSSARNYEGMKGLIDVKLWAFWDS